MNDFTQSRVVSIFLSLMLTCSLLPAPRQSTVKTAGPGNMPAAMNEALKGLGANGWTTPSEPALAPVATPFSVALITPDNAAPLSTDQLNKLISATRAESVRGPASKRLTRILGLTQGDDELIVQQYVHTEAGTTHFFTVPVDANVDRLILMVVEADRARWVVTDRSGRLLSANNGASVRRGEQPVVMNGADTKSLYNSEMVIWAAAADRLKSA